MIDKMYLMIKDLDVRRKKITTKKLHSKLFEEMTKGREYTTEQKRKVAETINLFLNSPYDKKGLTTKIKGMISLSEHGYNEMLKQYIQATTIVDEYTEGRIGRNNRIFDIMYSILTNEVTNAESFNPGNFDEAKKMGYVMQALRVSDKSYDELMAMSIDEVKNVINNNSNLMFVDTQVQFYKQNNAAGVLIGAFAVNNVCHSIFEEEGYQVDIESILNHKSFSINGMKFESYMELDRRLNNKSQSISKILASLVAASVDAVKDPILNLMNINGQTANYLITLCRMGMPFEDISLFMSQKCINSTLQAYYTANIDGFSSFTNIIQKRLRDLMKKNNIDETNSLFKEDITKEELISGIKEENDKTTMKVLNALLGIQKINNAISVFNFAAKYNSIKNAVGPLIIDNLIMQNRAEDYVRTENSNVYDVEYNVITLQSIFDSHPILKQFKNAYNVANVLLKDLPAASNSFKFVLNNLEIYPSLKSRINTDRKLLTQLSDFFQSYLLIQNNVVDETKLGYYVNKFPKEFMKIKKEYPDNKLVQAIQIKSDNNDKSVLYIDVSNLDQTEKQEFSNAWIDLHKQNPKLSIDLFNYNFFRGGIGFNPKSFMALLPVYVKEQIQGYKETFSKIPSVSSEELINQFISNNWRNNKLVPNIKNVTLERQSDNTYTIYSERNINDIGNSDFFKTEVDTNKKDKFGNNKKEYKIFKVISIERNHINVQEILKLGGKNDYIEMSKEPIKKSLDEMYNVEETTDIQQEQQQEVIESTMEESLDKVLPTEYEQTSLLQKIFGLTKTGTRSLQEANTIIERAKNNNSRRNETEKKTYLDALKSNTQKRLEKLGIKIDQEKVDKEFEKLC